MRRLWAFLALLAILVLAANGVLAADSSAGKAVYDRLCVNCHGPSGVGATGPAMNTVTFGQKYNTAASLRDVTRRGGPGMPAYGAELLTDADLENLIAYINSLVPAGYVTPGVEPTAVVASQAGATTTPTGAQAATTSATKLPLSLAELYALAVIAFFGFTGIVMSVAWILMSRGPV